MTVNLSGPIKLYNPKSELCEHFTNINRDAHENQGIAQIMTNKVNYVPNV